MTESNAERLERIKKLEPWVQVDDHDFDWLVEQAELAQKFKEEKERAEKLILKIYEYAGTSAEVDVYLWKETENYLGGRDEARRTLEANE